MKKNLQEDVLLPTNHLYRGNMGVRPPPFSNAQVWNNLPVRHTGTANYLTHSARFLRIRV